MLRSPVRAQEDLSQPAPLLLFLHGSGERGKGDGSELHKVLKHGPWQGGGADPFFILGPQCPRGHVWPAFVKEVSQLLDDVCIRHMIDKSRVFISGFSMGAFGTWSLAVTHPHKFAGILHHYGGLYSDLDVFPNCDRPVLPLNCQHQMVETTLLHCMRCA